MRIPSLQTLRAFEAAGRHCSYSKAGEELGLTHSAVSHRIRDLETLTGRRLFERRGNAMAPTRDGQRLLAQVRNALGLLESIFADSPGAKGRQRVTLSVFPAFASRWLAHRLGALRAAHPEIELALTISSDVVPLGDGVDCAVRYGPGGWPETQSRLLSDEILFPVASPACIAEARPAAPADLLSSVLLRYPWHSWAAWFRAAGVSAGEPTEGPEFPDSSLLVEAAVAGEGFALSRGLAAAEALRSGALVRPFDVAIPDKYSYYFVSPEGPRSPALDKVEAWLADAITQDIAVLKTPQGSQT
jgi:LysR family glycine cleavage system transcriptional activator